MKRSVLISLSIGLAAVISAPVMAKTGDAAAGATAYENLCVSCHGAAGEGNPKMYKKVNAKIVHLGSEEAQKKSDDFIRKVIVDGWGKMEKVEDVESPQQVDDVVAYVRTLRKK